MTRSTPTGSAPDSTAVRTALWRALHVEVDAPPHVLDDTLGLRLANPEPGWRDRPDMNPEATARFRASMVARARFVDDLVRDRVAAGVEQYVILGAGLDTFAVRNPDAAKVLAIYEIDQPGTQDWKLRRLREEGFDLPEGLHFVPVDFESGAAWRDALEANGFDTHAAAVVSSSGVAMYLSRTATADILRQAASLAHGSVFVMTFLLPVELVDDDERELQENVEKAAASSGTPFIGHYAPIDMVDMCLEAGFSSVRHVSPDMLTEHYFAGRPDGLRPPSAEHLVVAEV